MYKLSPIRGKQDRFVPVSSIRFFVQAGVITALMLTGLTRTASARTITTQTTLDKIEITVELKEESLKALFKKIESQTDLRFVFFENQINTFNGLSLSKATRSVRDVLELMLAGTGLSYIQSDNTVYIRKGSNNPGKNSGTSFVEKIPIAPVPLPAPPVQYFTVTGKVTAVTDGQPITGVSILVKGTTNGTTTDVDGQFTLTVDTKDYLVFSFIGYKSVEVPVAGRTLMEVSLEEDIATLQTVVVRAGYYDVKDIDRTSNISKVGADVIQKQPVTNPIAALSGRMPGVFIQQTTGMPGGDFNIQIRGRSSLRRDNGLPVGNDPLYVVDGVPFSTEKVSSPDNTIGLLGLGASPLTGLNPSDIESIEILKDADATAIYGSRGSNGVVLITTKRGKSGKTAVDVNFYTGVGKARTVQVLNTPQYLALRREAFALDKVTPSADPQSPYFAPELTLWDTTRYTDWQKIFLGGTAHTASLQASVSGGNEFTQFTLNGGYREETPVFPGDFKYNKTSAHLAVTHASMDKKFLLTAGFSGTIDNNKQVRIDATNLARRLAPNAPPVYNEDGTLNWENSTWDNPFSTQAVTYNSRVNTLVSNVTLSYELLLGLKIKTNAGYTSVQSKEFTFTPSTAYNPVYKRTSAYSNVLASQGTNSSWIVEPQMSWERDIAEGHLSILLGTTFQEQQFERVSSSYLGFPSNALLKDLKSAAQVTPREYILSLYRYAAAFGRLNYNYRGRYIINLTGRRDGSSRFGPGRQFANFGAIGAAWIFSAEPFFKNQFHFVSFGKLRGSYGVTGNDQIGNYQYFDTYATGTPPSANQYQGVTGLNPTRLFNPNFAWETNRKLEGALDLGFLSDRIFLSVAYFRNRSSNQLVDYTLPMTTGFSSIVTNLNAVVQNTGVELELTTVNLRSDFFKWTTSLNATMPRNKLIEFPGLVSSSYALVYILGKSIYTQQVYESTGVDPQTGLFTFKDLNADDQITPLGDKRKPVSVTQNFYGGINNTISYKGLSIDIFFQFVKQNGYNYWQDPAFPYFPGTAPNMAALVLDEKIWHKPGDNATLQRPATSVNQAASNAYLMHSSSDATISDASFVRFKNLSISYMLPRYWISKLNCRVYLQGQNLFVMTRYKWFDPESQFTNMAPLRMITAGAQFTL